MEKEVINVLRYALYEIRDSLKHDKKYSGEVLLCTKALEAATIQFGKWDGSGIIIIDGGK
jgi:hypothetical protein